MPFVGRLGFGELGGPLTVLGLVAVMNVVNLSDGIDGLAAGVCAISAGALAVIAFDLQRTEGGVLAALTAGAALGFLIHNFHPASVYMGDCGSNLLGLLLGCVAVLGSAKTNAVLALIFPLIVLAVPFLDTTFVVLKRMKYRRPVYAADREHFHHRLDRIGFSTRRTVLYLYAWTLSLAGLAIALRFVPYSDNGGTLHPGWAAVMAGLGLRVVIASVYLVYVLEILKFKRLDAARLRRASRRHRAGDRRRRRRAPGDRRVRRRAPRDRGVRAPGVLIRGPPSPTTVARDARLQPRRRQAVSHDRRLDDPRARGTGVAAVGQPVARRGLAARRRRDRRALPPDRRGALLLPRGHRAHAARRRAASRWGPATACSSRPARSTSSRTRATSRCGCCAAARRRGRPKTPSSRAADEHPRAMGRRPAGRVALLAAPVAAPRRGAPAASRRRAARRAGAAAAEPAPLVPAPPAPLLPGGVRVGIGDQKADMFTDPRFVALGVRYARLAIGWDAMTSLWQIEQLDDWLARRAR